MKLSAPPRPRHRASRPLQICHSALRLAPLTILIATAPIAAADIIPIPPGNVTSSSQIGAPFNRQDDFLVDGSGLVAGQHVAAVQPNMWLTMGTCCGGVEDPDPWVQFDLGAVYTITSIHVWNYNEAPPNLTNRGVNGVTIEYGETAALGSTVAGISNFAQASGLDTYTGEVFDGFAPFSARYIKFDIISNHGDGNIFYGLSEVQFDGRVRGLAVSPMSFVTSSSQGAAVGTLETSGGDPGDTFGYVLVAGAGDDDNDKFQIVGDELQIGAHDFSTAADGEEFSIRVRSTGVPSGEELDATLTLIASTDSDGDGLVDAWEERWAGVGNLAVLSGIGGANSDGDTLTDLEEFNLREQFPNLDPTSPDSDGDGLEDGSEIAGAGVRPPTDPTNPDTDGDTLSDAVETNTRVFVGPTDTGSNPLLVDSDGDLYNDAEEVLAGSDPSDPNSTPPVTLVGYWPFDADSDPQPDLSEFGNDATVFAGATWVDDAERGGVMQFDGNDSYLEAADSESLSLTDDLTIAAWINVNDYAGFRGIVGKSAGPAGNLPASYDLYLLQGGGMARFFTGSPDGFGQVTGTTVPATGEWHHLAVTRIGDDVTIYYDGQLDAQGVTAAPMLDSDAALRIGNRTDLVTDFFGRMDDVAIFAGGLSAEQVMAIMGGDFSEFGAGGGASRFRITSVVKGETLVGGELVPSVALTFNSRSNRNYKIQASTSLKAEGLQGGWIELDDSFPSQGETTTFVDTLAAGAPGLQRIYYRVVEAP